jgi:hypothetical protein
MKSTITFLLPLLFFFSGLHSQTSIDSLRLKFQKDSAHTYRFKKLRPWFALDERNSWIRNEKGTKKVPVTIDGIQAGIILKEKHTIGIGLYTMNGSSQKPVKLSDGNNKITYQELLMKYSTLYYQYEIVDTRFFELDVPIEFGLGRYVYNLKNETQTQLLWREQGLIKISGGGVRMVLKPLRWIGLYGTGGYRIVVFNKKTNLNFNGAYYSYGIWVDIRQIYRDIKFYGFLRPKYRKKVKAILASKP